MTEIQAQEKSIRVLLSEKYAVDSYQREYKWEEKQIDDLVDDLLAEFSENYKDGHELNDVKNYGQYFLGPIIVGKSDNKNYIVDGQQRLTTLTLALICLIRIVDDDDQKTGLRNLVYSKHYGAKSFQLDVPERTECLHQLYEGTPPVNVSDASESIRNLVVRYEQLNSRLADELSPKQIPLFAVWFIEKIHLVEIKTSSGAGAYKIFETMNDRGLRLTPAEMLKGYLLSVIGDDQLRESANKSWKKRVDELTNHRKGEDADAIKAWLRARYAQRPTDFEEIGSQFHRWVRDNGDTLKLETSEKFAGFITRDFAFYAKIFLRLRRAAEKFDAEPGLECVYYLAQHSFTLQYPLLLAPLTPEDSERDIVRKLRVVSTYLDILIHRRIGNWKTVAESAMRSHIFGLIPEIRDKNVHEISDFLASNLEQDEFTTTLDPQFALHGQNRPRIHRILARITDYVETKRDYVETKPDRSSHYPDYFVSGKKAFQIEHIWHANYDVVRKEESINSDDLSESDFWNMRDYIGGLVLLPQQDNASYGDISYSKKRKYYYSQNTLAGSLHENCYERNTSFLQFKEKSGFLFKPHAEFQKSDLLERQELYQQIAEEIWHPKRLHIAANDK